MHPVPLYFVRHDKEIGGAHYAHVKAEDIPVWVISLMQTSSGGVEKVLQPEDVIESILHVRHMCVGPSRHSGRHTCLAPENQVSRYPWSRFIMCIPVDTVDPLGFPLSGENLVAGGWW